MYGSFPVVHDKDNREGGEDGGGEAMPAFPAAGGACRWSGCARRGLGRVLVTARAQLEGAKATRPSPSQRVYFARTHLDVRNRAKRRQSDKFTQRSLSDSVLDLCVPVFFSKHMAYTWYVPRPGKGVVGVSGVGVSTSFA
uniref:Uncharacterized protein n=1 Tax=Ananas comosus var. bracteatus TaxID=296719 RepID=A0A6V7PYI8_ANACO|nr:unnamed protein product [Ananas comosus var. bracteatus]